MKEKTTDQIRNEIMQKKQNEKRKTTCGCFFMFFLLIIFSVVLISNYISSEARSRTEAAKREIEQIRRNTQVMEDRQEDSEAELLKLYFNEKFSELQKFRYDIDFHKIGFGTGGKYNTWMKQCEELGERAEKTLKNGKYFDLKACPGYMIQVAIEYMKSRGEETKYTLETVPEIKKTIDREKYLKKLEAIEQQRKKQ